MLTVKKLRRRPRQFHAFTGLTPEQFDTLLGKVEGAYAKAMHERRERPGRKRAVGAGHPFALPLGERLLLGLVFLRRYMTQGLLAFLFNLDEATVSRELHKRLLPVLLQVLPTPLRDAPLRPDPKAEGEAPGKPISTLSELLALFPEMEEVLIDATEQEVEKPKEPHARRVRYSGKKKKHTVKTQVTTTRTLILHVFGGLPGSLHDFTLLRASGVLGHVPNDVKVRVDRGYEGVEREHAGQVIEKPLRRGRGQRLTALGRAYNRMVSALRMAVEHMLSRVKQFGVMAGVYRGEWEEHEDLFVIVSGLVNYKALGRLSWA